jgi:hypothetical protein
MTGLTDLHDRWLDEPAYQAAHAVSENESMLACELIDARVRAGLPPEQLAQCMGTTQSFIARLESGATDAGRQDIGAFGAGDRDAVGGAVREDGRGVG